METCLGLRLRSLVTALRNSDVDQAVPQHSLEDAIKALDTHCMHRISILGGKTKAVNTRTCGRFVMGQLGRPQEDTG